MLRLVEESGGAFAFEAAGDPPDRYTVEFAAPGFALDADRAVVTRPNHRFDAYLHVDYPRQAPLLRWRTPVHHPNVLSPGRGGHVCLATWAPSFGLADVCRRLRAFVSLEDWEESGVIDPVAAEFAAARRRGLGAARAA
jgi:hypothetical protein